MSIIKDLYTNEYIGPWYNIFDIVSVYTWVLLKKFYNNVFIYKIMLHVLHLPLHIHLSSTYLINKTRESKYSAFKIRSKWFAGI